MKKKTFKLLFVFMILIINPLLVSANNGGGKDTDSYIECWYRNNEIYYSYNVTTNKFVFEGKKISMHSWDTKLMKNDFIDKQTNSLKCPSIYATTSGAGGRSSKTTVTKTKTSGASVYHEPNKVNKRNELLTTTKTCIYNSDKFQIEFILNISNKTIVSSRVNGYDAATNEFKYDEIFKDEKCIDLKEIYGSCYYGDRGGPTICNITKTTSTGHPNSGNTDLDEESSTGAEEPETPTNPEENVYGCEVIPDEIREWIKDSLNLVKYIALVLVIVLGVLDFIKAAASGEADQMKKSGNSFLKRIIAVVILFLLPLIVELILNLIEIFGADSTCLPK